jgi:hypothetical protein
MDELLAEVELKEDQQTEAYFDLLIAKAAQLEEKIASNFKTAEEEVKIINDFYLKKNAKIQESIEGISRLLEEYIRSKGEKTISLPHGTLKLHKKPDKVEVADLDLFMQYATEELLTVVPESFKPNLNKIKNYIKLSGRIPKGVNRIEGTEEFKLTINYNSNNN